MPKANVNGISLYYEDHGHGYPLIWSHEFAGDHRSWEPQVRFMDGLHRTIDWYYATKDRDTVRMALEERLTER